MLGVHLFNLSGYTLIFDYFIRQSNKQLIQQLDNNQYNDNELIAVKVALHTPYLSNWSDYERVDGEVEVNGVYYSYVKRKIHNDTLYLLCLPNKNKNQLTAARIEYASKAQDAPANAKDPGTGKKNPAGNEYQQPTTQFHVALLSVIPHQNFKHPAPTVIQSFISGPFHPPRG